jgi:RNA polymerase sigma factor (sigma-70 family)
VNGCLDRLKSPHKRLRSALDEERVANGEPNSLNTIAEEELIQKALKRLTWKKRRAFILVDLEGFSGPEAAEILGCSESTVRVTVMKARQKIRKCYLELTAS